MKAIVLGGTRFVSRALTAESISCRQRRAGFGLASVCSVCAAGRQPSTSMPPMPGGLAAGVVRGRRPPVLECIGELLIVFHLLRRLVERDPASLGNPAARRPLWMELAVEQVNGPGGPRSSASSCALRCLPSQSLSAKAPWARTSRRTPTCNRAAFRPLRGRRIPERILLQLPPRTQREPSRTIAMRPSTTPSGTRVPWRAGLRGRSCSWAACSARGGIPTT